MPKGIYVRTKPVWNKGKPYPQMIGNTFGFKKGQVSWIKGKHWSKEAKKKMREAKLGKYGKDTNRWKGGKCFEGGYISISKHNHPFSRSNGRISEHRFIMEKHLGRYLKSKEVVHHINNNPFDNRIKNLMLFANQSKHIKFHNLKS